MDNEKKIIDINNIKQNILPKFFLDNAQITMVKFKDTSKQRAVFKVTLNQKNYCLKKVYYDESNLLFVYSAMEWLYRNNIKVPKLLPSYDNRRYIFYENMLFILTPWVEGEKCNFDSLSDLNLSIKTLAKLHKCSKDFIPIDGSKKRIGLDNYYLCINKHFNDLLENANLAFSYNDKFSRLYLNNLNTNLSLAKLSLEIASFIDFKDLSISLCHGDYVNKNIYINLHSLKDSVTYKVTESFLTNCQIFTFLTSHNSYIILNTTLSWIEQKPQVHYLIGSPHLPGNAGNKSRSPLPMNVPSRHKSGWNYNSVVTPWLPKYAGPRKYLIAP